MKEQDGIHNYTFTVPDLPWKKVKQIVVKSHIKSKDVKKKKKLARPKFNNI